MKIIIYSCNVATFDSEHFEITSFPSCKQQWDITTNLFFEHDIVIVTTLPGRFLIDYKANNIIEKSKKIIYIYHCWITIIYLTISNNLIN